MAARPAAGPGYTVDRLDSAAAVEGSRLMRGRKAQPAEVVAAKGDPGKRGAVAATDDLPELKSAAPKELTREGKAVRSALAPELRRIKLQCPLYGVVKLKRTGIRRS